jgi:hypothetical protein
MPNGKPGDHPYTDIVIHGRDVYLSDDKTQRKLADLLFSEYNEFNLCSTDEIHTLVVMQTKGQIR